MKEQLTGRDGFAFAFAEASGCDYDTLEEFLVTLTSIQNTEYEFFHETMLKIYAVVDEKAVCVLSLTVAPCAVWCSGQYLQDRLEHLKKPPFSHLQDMLVKITDDGTFIDIHKLLEFQDEFVISVYQITRL